MDPRQYTALGEVMRQFCMSGGAIASIAIDMPDWMNLP
jgi:hypothetical protein